MGTYIINLSDTVALSDSTLIELAKVLNSCQPCMQGGAETNCNDVWIVFIVCAAIVGIALIAKCAVLSWKQEEIKSKKDDRDAKNQKEKEDCERKQSSDLKDKLLSFLEKNTIKEEYNEDLDKTIKTMRGIDSDESQYYIHVLKSLIEGTDIPEYNTQNEVSNEGEEEKPVA